MTDTVKDICDFVEARKFGTKLERFSYTQICHYVWENVRHHTIRVAFGPNCESILGVIIFNPNLRGQFWVNQFFGNGPEMWSLFLSALTQQFPNVTEIWGIRKNNRFVKFNVSTLIKLYGRRS